MIRTTFQSTLRYKLFAVGYSRQKYAYPYGYFRVAYIHDTIKVIPCSADDIANVLNKPDLLIEIARVAKEHRHNINFKNITHQQI